MRDCEAERQATIVADDEGLLAWQTDADGKALGHQSVAGSCRWRRRGFAPAKAG